MILPNYLKNKTRNLWDLWNYTLKTKHGVPDFLSNYFKNKTRNLRDPTNHFKNKTRDPWDISNCFKNKTCDPLNCVKKKTKGVPEILQITSKIRYKRFPRFSQTTSRTKQKGSRDSAKLLQKQEKGSPRSLKLRQIQHDEWYPRYFRLLPKQDLRSFELLQKENKRAPRDFFLSFKLLQTPDTKGPRDSLKLLQKQIKDLQDL